MASSSSTAARAERSPFNPDASLGRSRESMANSNSGVFEEEKLGVIKSGWMQGGFTPFKGKGKAMYVVLAQRAIEIYESEKAYVRRKPSKYTIDLAISFNVHNNHVIASDPKLPKCVCVMQPDTTLLLKFESEAANLEWFEAIKQTCSTARAVRLGRYVWLSEFFGTWGYFEAAFDVTIVDTPRKVAQKKGEEPPMPNVIEKYPHLEGTRRICFYPHTIYLCLKNIEPAREDDLPPGGSPPFKAIHVFEIQRKFIPNFGFRDNYFILMMGRGAPMGACELWAECESKAMAAAIHHTLNDIIHREGEKKMQLNNGPQQAPSLPSMPSGRHRERSHTQPHRQRLASEIIAGGPSSPSGGSDAARERRSKLRESKALVESFEEEQRNQHRGSITINTPPKAGSLLDTGRRNTNSPLANLLRKPSTGTVACTSGSHRTPPTKLGAPSTSQSSAGNTTLPVPGLRHSFAAPGDAKNKLIAHTSVFPVRRQSETIKEEASSYQPMDPSSEARKLEMEQLMRGEMQGYRAVSPSTTRSSTDETEDSGGTLRCYGETEDSGGTLKMGVSSRPHSPNNTIRNLSLVQQTPRPYEPLPLKSKADHLSSSEDDADADVISAGTNTSTGGESISAELDYAHMDSVNWNGEAGSSLSVPLSAFSHHRDNHPAPPRSFVSSSDSCYSSIAERQAKGGHHSTAATPEAPPKEQFRTYSFGPGHPSFQRPGDPIRSGVLEPKKLSSEGISAANGADAAAAGSNAAKEADRKRAFSLGSKSFFANLSRPFRKVSSRARHAPTSASAPGASLASSTVSSGVGGGQQPSSVSSNHIAGFNQHPFVDDPRNRSGSFGSGRSTPYSKRSGPIEASSDHLMELDFGGEPQHGRHGLGGRCGSGSMGSVDSPSRSRTSSFGCQLKRADEYRIEDENGLTPSQILLQKAKQLSIDAAETAPPHVDTSEYVLTEAPPPSERPSYGYHHHHQHQSHHSPDHHSATPHQQMTSSSSTVAPPPPPAVQYSVNGGVQDVMGKSHEARSSQYFETIEETTSGRSSRASSIDESSTTVKEALSQRVLMEEEDDYAEMDVSKQQTTETTVEAVVEIVPPPAAAQLQPADSRHSSSRSRSASPAASSTRRADSAATLQSVASSSDRSDRENRDVQQLQQKEKEQQPPPRQKMSTHSEGPHSLLTAAASSGGLPKRSSVPVLKDQDLAAQGDPAALNYAFLQLNGAAAPSSHHDVSRGRSKSGILFASSSRDSAAAAAASAAVDQTTVEYAICKPVVP